MPRGSRDLSSLTRDQSPLPCVGRWTLNHCTTSEVPRWAFLIVLRIRNRRSSLCIFPFYIYSCHQLDDTITLNENLRTRASHWCSHSLLATFVWNFVSSYLRVGRPLRGLSALLESHQESGGGLRLGQGFSGQRLPARGWRGA